MDTVKWATDIPRTWLPLECPAKGGKKKKQMTTQVHGCDTMSKDIAKHPPKKKKPRDLLYLFGDQRLTLN